MKELSENVKYINVVRQMVADGQVSQDVAEKYFPELKESEDERIRKRLIQYFSTFRLGTFAGIEPKKIIDWLEKQKEFVSADFDDVWETADCNELTAPLEKYSKDAIKEMCHAWYDKGIELERRNWLEKKGWKKTVPKFEVGDVMRTLQEAADNITSGLPVVVSIDDEDYHCTNERIAIKDQDNYEYPPINRKQKTVERFDYSNADIQQKDFAPKVEPKFKVGDWIIFNGLTLYIKEIVKGYYRTISYDGIPNSYDWGIDNAARLWTIADARPGDVLATSAGVFIYNGNNGGGSCPGCYCGIDTLGRFKTGVEHHWTGKKVYPATKEQSDLLFQKMSDAGYAFDFYNKEMIKIEDELSTGVEIPFGAKDSELEEVSYSIPNGFHAEIEDDKVVIKKGEQKSWSEEDNFMYNKIKNLLTDISLAPESINSLFDWLKDLKDRVQPQTTRKPSDEQIKVCKEVYADILSAKGFDLGTVNSELNRLEEELKKLME